VIPQGPKLGKNKARRSPIKQSQKEQEPRARESQLRGLKKREV